MKDEVKSLCDSINNDNSSDNLESRIKNAIKDYEKYNKGKRKNKVKYFKYKNRSEDEH